MPIMKKLKMSLDGQPKVKLEEGIKETFKYYSQFKKYYW